MDKLEQRAITAYNKWTKAKKKKSQAIYRRSRILLTEDSRLTKQFFNSLSIED